MTPVLGIFICFNSLFHYFISDDDSDDTSGDEANESNEDQDKSDEEDDEFSNDSEDGTDQEDSESNNEKAGPSSSKKQDKPDDTTEEQNEYEYDSSDEEDIRNTIGNVPIQWYEDYDHLGYNLDGKQIRKPKRGDELDAFLRMVEDGNAGVTVQDPMTGQDVVLSAKQIEAIRRVSNSKGPDGKYNLYEDLVDWFSSEPLQTPVRDLPDSKKSFLPSISERKKVSKMLHSIRMGWMKTRAELDKDKRDKQENQYYMLWSTDDQAEDMRRINDLIPAPKMKLPGHAESYNPPPEYLFTEKEKQDWKEKADEPYKRKLPFIPQKYESLRKVPAFKTFINERFTRCLDLYLAPRARKMRLTIQPEDLIPQLPKPKDLQPFPSACVLTYKGHKNMIRSLSIDTSGQFIASGCDDGTVKIWEIQTGYCMKTFSFGKVAIKGVQWCPNKALCLLAVAVENMVVILNGHVGDKVIIDQTDELVSDPPEISDYVPPDRVKTAVTWSKPGKSDNLPKEALILLKFFKPVKQVTWHGKGDHFATVLSDGQNRSVLVHQLSKWRSKKILIIFFSFT